MTHNGSVLNLATQVGADVVFALSVDETVELADFDMNLGFTPPTTFAGSHGAGRRQTTRSSRSGDSGQAERPWAGANCPPGL